jgi:hypothetical protein
MTKIRLEREIRVTWRGRQGHDGRVNGGKGDGLTGELADAVANPDTAGTAVVMARLAGLGGSGWLRLDESARRWYPSRSLLAEAGRWRLVLASVNAPAGVVAASMCRDGRVRQAAVAALAGMPEPAAAAALAVRVADRVPEVSFAARTALAPRTAPQDASAATMLLTSATPPSPNDCHVTPVAAVGRAGASPGAALPGIRPDSYDHVHLPYWGTGYRTRS